MTNEVACAAAAGGVTDKIANEFSSQLTQGQELWNQILAWLSERGVSFAINLLLAVLILVIGAFTIKLIRAATAKALLKVKPLTAIPFLLRVLTKNIYLNLRMMIHSL